MLTSTRYEYLFVLLIYFAAGATILWSAVRRLLCQRVFWASSAAFVILGMTIDLLAIHWGWWSWSSRRVCGLAILSIPVEEYVGFFIGHMLVVAGWEIVSNDLA